MPRIIALAQWNIGLEKSGPFVIPLKYVTALKIVARAKICVFLTT